jgi:hypothetical protein
MLMDGTPDPAATHINLLGPFAIETPAPPTPRMSIAAPRQRAMIAYVAINGGRVSREQLAILFWGYLGHAIIRNFVGDMIRKLSETSSQ